MVSANRDIRSIARGRSLTHTARAWQRLAYSPLAGAGLSNARAAVSVTQQRHARPRAEGREKPGTHTHKLRHSTSHHIQYARRQDRPEGTRVRELASVRSPPPRAVPAWVGSSEGERAKEALHPHDAAAAAPLSAHGAQSKGCVGEAASHARPPARHTFFCPNGSSSQRK